MGETGCDWGTYQGASAGVSWLEDSVSTPKGVQMSHFLEASSWVLPLDNSFNGSLLDESLVQVHVFS